MIKVDLSGAEKFWGDRGPNWEVCAAAHRTLAGKSGLGSDFLGWLELARRLWGQE